MPSAKSNHGFYATYNAKNFKKAVKKYQARGGSLKRLLEQAGEIVEEATLKRLMAGRNVDGSKFKDLSPAYKASKKKNKDKILKLTGNMQNTLTWQLTASGKSVQIGFGSKVAKYHMSNEPRKKIPLRNPLGITAADEKEILDVAEDILALGNR